MPPSPRPLELAYQRVRKRPTCRAGMRPFESYRKSAIWAGDVPTSPRLCSAAKEPAPSFSNPRTAEQIENRLGARSSRKPLLTAANCSTAVKSMQIAITRRRRNERYRRPLARGEYRDARLTRVRSQAPQKLNTREFTSGGKWVRRCCLATAFEPASCSERSCTTCTLPTVAAELI